MPVWDAEIRIDEALVRAVLAEHFPELDAASARLLGEGFDNSVWVVEGRLAFRFPRRAVAVPLVAREIALLPGLARIVPIAVPVPTHVGAPADAFPWPFFGAPFLPGLEPSEARIADADRVRLGGQLGRFLLVLHDQSTCDALDPGRALPIDPNRRADMELRVPRTREQLGALEGAGDWHAPEAARTILEEAERLSQPAADLVLAHGDLHLRHVLVADGIVSAVIDWGDVCLADPCVDLVLVWSLLPPAGRARFVAEYGPVDEEGRLRSRVLALHLCSMLALYARDIGHAALQRESIAGLERTLVDDWG